jgi:hypothetical protein
VTSFDQLARIRSVRRPSRDQNIGRAHRASAAIWRTGWTGGVALVAWLTVHGDALGQAGPTVRRTAHLSARFEFNTADTSHRSPTPGIVDVKGMIDGRILALDSARRLVTVLSADGQVEAAFGSVGTGSGRLRSATALVVRGTTVHVHDAVAGKWEVFDVTGRHLRTVQANLPDRSLDRVLPMRGGTTLIERSPSVPTAVRGEPAPESLLRHIGIRTPAARSEQWLFSIRIDRVFLIAAPPAPAFISSARSGFRRPTLQTAGAPVVPRFGAGGAWAVAGDSMIAHVDGYTGAVVWYSIDASGARELRSANVGRTGSPVDTSDRDTEARRLAAIAAARRGAGTGRARVNEGGARLLGVPPYWSVATRALFSNDGTLWSGVNRQYTAVVGDAAAVRIGEENTWAVFPAGDAAFTVTLRPLFWVTDVVGSRVYGFVWDGVSPPVVEVYEIL